MHTVVRAHEDKDMQARAYRVTGTLPHAHACADMHRETHTRTDNGSDGPRCAQAQTHRSDLITVAVTAGVCWMLTAYQAPRWAPHTPPHLILPNLYLQPRRQAVWLSPLDRRRKGHRDVRGHTASARAGVLTQFCLTREPSLRYTRP